MTTNDQPSSAPLSSPAATTATATDQASRLHGVDALRGVAAVLVLLFHFTTRYDQKFGHASAPLFSVPWGYLGVNLFFMVSGFVIFMTLDRLTRPMDFLVSRLSRLYPAYWVAACLTFATLSFFPEIGKTISSGHALTNILMFEGLFGVPPIDGVYWTLEVELLFYWAMFLLWLSVGLGKPQRWLGLWLLLSVGYGLAGRLGINTPYVAAQFLILPYIPYFALGMLLYLRFQGARFRWPVEGLLGLAAILAIGLIDSPLRLVSTAAFLAAFYVLVIAKIFRGNRVVALAARVGAISYPLYLLHENIGWTLIHHLEQQGIEANAAIAMATVLAFSAALLLHKTVEKPAMNAIRAWYRSRPPRQPIKLGPAFIAAARRRWAWWALSAGVLALIGNRIAMHA